MGESTTAKIVQKTTGMWWPDADADGLREVADAWRVMATAIDDVRGPTGKAAHSVIDGNHGKAIDAFHTFWNRYDSNGKGWLPQTAHACRQMAKALDEFADEVDKAVHKLEEEAAIVGATLVAGTALAFFTAGISEAAAGAATAGIVAAAETVGVAVSETVASIAATTLTGAAFGAVESVAVDVAVAQPVRIAFGDGGFSGTELLDAAETGGLGGGLGAGAGAGARAVGKAATGAEGASTVLAGIGKISTGMDTMPGRMVTGAAMGAGQDALFNGGHVNPLDVATGAIGGAAGPGGRKGHEFQQADTAHFAKSSLLDEIRTPLLDRSTEGLRPIRALDQHMLEEAMPRASDGSFEKHADPTKSWVQHQNDGGISVPGRSNNCADSTRSFLETWYGNPRVSAARTPDLLPDGTLDRATPEHDSVGNMEKWTGAGHSEGGWGYAGYKPVHDDLIAGGHGSSAMVGVSWPGGGGHAFAAVNHHGTVHWVDPQSGVVGTHPIHPGAEHVRYIPLGPDRMPMRPGTRLATP